MTVLRSLVPVLRRLVPVLRSLVPYLLNLGPVLLNLGPPWCLMTLSLYCQNVPSFLIDSCSMRFPRYRAESDEEQMSQRQLAA